MATRKVLGLMLLVFMIAFLPAQVQAGNSTGVTDTEIKIGVFAPFTGPAQLYGYPMSAGATMIYKDVNEKGGIHGRKIKIIEEDGACSPEKTVAAVKKLIFDHKVFMINGGNCSSAVYAAKQTIMKEGIPHMLLAATMDKITAPAVKNIFTAQLPGSADGRLVAKFILSNPKIKRVGLLTHPNEWGMTKYKPAYAALKASKKVEIVADERIDRKIADATVQILKFKQAKPDVVFFNTYPVEGVIVLRDAQKYRLNVPILGGSSWDVRDLRSKLNYDAVKNVYQLSGLVGDVQSKALEPWVKLAKKHNPGVKIVNLTFLPTSGALMVVEALKRVGKDLTREKFIKELEGIQNFKTSLLPYSIGFTPTDHQATKRGTFLHMKSDGVVLAVGDTWPK